MQSTNILAVVGLLALAVAVVVGLLRLMRSRQAVHERRSDTVVDAPPPHPPGEAEDYLDSSHIGGPILPGRERDPRR